MCVCRTLCFGPAVAIGSPIFFDAGDWLIIRMKDYFLPGRICVEDIVIDLLTMISVPSNAHSAPERAFKYISSGDNSLLLVPDRADTGFTVLRASWNSFEPQIAGYSGSPSIGNNQQPAVWRTEILSLGSLGRRTCLTSASGSGFVSR